MTDKNKRIYYKQGPMSINGIRVRGAKLISISTYFQLNQCFCSCPSPLSSMYEEYPNLNNVVSSVHGYLEVHDETCPNATKLDSVFLRDVTEEEMEKYRAIWCSNR